MTRIRLYLLANLAAAIVVSCNAGILSAQRLPSPDSSRPPRLTRLTLDSIRLQVRELWLMELLSGLQRGDGATIDATLEGVQWGLGDAASRVHPQCQTLGRAVSAMTPRVQTAPGLGPGRGGLLPIYFSKVVIADSEGVGVASAAVTIVISPGSQRSTPIRLSYDRARWTSIAGLLKAVCDVATGAVR
jgi:hypothetical protein